MNTASSRPLVCLLLPLLSSLFASPGIASPPVGGLPNQNTYDGDHTLTSLTSWSPKYGPGYNALHAVTAGNSNTAVGASSLQSATGGANIAIGAGAGVNITTGNFNIDIGNQGVSGDSSTIRIGDSNQSAPLSFRSAEPRHFERQFMGSWNRAKRPSRHCRSK